MEPDRSPALVRTDAAAMPSLARFRRHEGDLGWYVVVDPAGRYPVQAGIERSIDFGPAVRGLIFLVCVVGCGLWAARDETSTPVALLVFVLGGCAGVVLGQLLSALVKGLPQTWHRWSANGPRLRVEPGDRRAWRLCEAAAGLAATGSWTDRTVDPQRRVPAILWSAVERSLAVERRYRDAERALDHESLHDLGRETLAGVERERASLDEVEANLRTVLAAALDIDGRRDRRARERRKRAEERALRSRMTGGLGPVPGPIESDLDADASAGLAAEARAVAELLAASDALLQELD